MGRTLKIILLTVLFAMLSADALSQVKIYTKKTKMADFLTKTTKVVLSGNSPVEIALKNEVSAVWRVSSYEFCSVEDYERFSTRADFYFLRFVTEEGVLFLSLSKGGDKDSEDTFVRPFEVGRIPVATEGRISGREMIFIGAYLEILQSFAEKSMSSDRIGYVGIGAAATNFFKGKKILLNEEKADEAYSKGTGDAVVPVFVVSSNGHDFYKMLISADSHELIYFGKGRMKKEGEIPCFNDTELKTFKKKDAEII